MLNKVAQNVIRNRFLYKSSVESFIRCKHRAAFLKEIGKPLVLEEIKPVEKIANDEVRVNVHYCSLNATDVRVWSGKHSFDYKLPMIPGHEYSGIVEEVGSENEAELSKGDRVVAMNDLIDETGGLTTEVIVKNRDCWLIPHDLSLRECAVLPYGHGTALLVFSKLFELKEDDLVLITTGPAGMGLAAVDVAVNVYKAKVIVICDTESSSDMVRQKGAFKTISMGKNFTKLYKELCDAMGTEKAILGYDAVGKGLLHLVADFVDPIKGKLISVDPFYSKEKFMAEKPDFELPKKKEKKSKEQDAANIPVEVEKNKLLENITHLDIYDLPDKELYRQIIEDTITLCEEGIISGHISKVFKLSDIQKAIEFIQKKQCTGKVLIDILEKDGDVSHEESKED